VRKAGLLVAALFFGFAAGAYSQSLSLSVSAGGFFPKNKIYQEIYGTGRPFDFKAQLRLFKNFGLAAGICYISQTGDAVNIESGPDRYPVQFRRVSFPLSAYVFFPLNKVIILGGAGLSIHSYEEEWETVAMSFKGDMTKPFVYAGLEYGIQSWFAARLTIRYESLKAGLNPFIDKEVNLGGLTLLVGISIRVFEERRFRPPVSLPGRSVIAGLPKRLKAPEINRASPPRQEKVTKNIKWRPRQPSRVPGRRYAVGAVYR
jgi:hypothetical protein